ncbi:MAG: cyclic nucleotide-binding domain-containing protein, partial [Polyangiaceae bacterium]
MSWPDVVWGAAALRGVDERGRSEIEAAGGLQTHARGELIFASGEPADDFFVVESGEVEVRAVARGEESARLLRRV